MIALLFVLFLILAIWLAVRLGGVRRRDRQPGTSTAGSWDGSGRSTTSGFEGGGGDFGGGGASGSWGDADGGDGGGGGGD